MYHRVSISRNTRIKQSSRVIGFAIIFSIERMKRLLAFLRAVIVASELMRVANSPSRLISSSGVVDRLAGDMSSNRVSDSVGKIRNKARGAEEQSMWELNVNR